APKAAGRVAAGTRGGHAPSEGMSGRPPGSSLPGGRGRLIVCLDANIVIYLVEANPVWSPGAVARVAQIRAAGDAVAVCDAARLECLAGPLVWGTATDIATYRRFVASPLVHLLPVTAAVWERAALVGATYNLKPLDSLHLAAAIEQGCGLFLTNDAKLARCTDITVEVLR